MLYFGEDDHLILAIDLSWSDDHGMAIQGWILSKQQPFESVEIRVGDVSIPVTSWHPRPDVTDRYPQYSQRESCGFLVYVPRLARHHFICSAQTKENRIVKSVEFSGEKPALSFQSGDREDKPSGDSSLFLEFIDRVNNQQLQVLEIGSRVVSPGSASRRSLFPGASSFTGFDYYLDANTDVVGDAHQLASYFIDQRFGAIFSLAVLEHLAMPWIVPLEINKVLQLGGLTFHTTHFAWPLHEKPWDFWRFSDDGLRVLFSRSLGFEVIRAEMFDPLRMHPDHVRPELEQMPFNPGFAGACVLAKKVADVDEEKFRWNMTLEDVLGKDSQYPNPEEQEPQKPM